MYCSSCGNTVKDGLKYCNGCGAKLGPERDDSPAKMLNDILETLFWTAFLGLGILVGLVAVMLKGEIKQEIVGIVIVFYLAVLGMISFLLLRQMPKLIDAKLRSIGQPDETSSTRSEIRPSATAQLDEYREPAMSVTDHTTKTLDKVHVGER